MRMLFLTALEILQKSGLTWLFVEAYFKSSTLAEPCNTSVINFINLSSIYFSLFFSPALVNVYPRQFKG